MKKNKCLIATLLVFSMMLVASIGAISVFASSDDSADASKTAEETSAVVSGCDLKKENLVEVKVKQYNFSMKVPDGHLITVEGPTEAFTEVSNYSRPYFMEQGCIMQTFTDNDNYCAVSVFVNELPSIYNYYGDYSSLTKEQQEELIKDAISSNKSSSEDDVSAKFVKINGRSYLEVYLTEASNDAGGVYYQYQFTTVIDNMQYTIYIQAMNMIDSDKTVVNDMINSIKLGGMGASVSTVEIILIIVCIVLVAAAALAYFFLFRVDALVKAGVKDYAVIGFDIPKLERVKKLKSSITDDDDDDDEDDEDDEDLDDDEVSEDEESNDGESDDDERIIKD